MMQDSYRACCCCWGHCNGHLFGWGLACQALLHGCTCMLNLERNVVGAPIRCSACIGMSSCCFAVAPRLPSRRVVAGPHTCCGIGRACERRVSHVFFRRLCSIA